MTKPKSKVVEAYMTHNRTPFITLVYSNGRIRKIARAQYLGDAARNRREVHEILPKKYGKAWKGVLKQI